jgi:phospholipid-binding lipoprotein MlaA
MCKLAISNLLLFLMLILPSGHVQADEEQDIDPFQNLNRTTHQFNLKLDKYIARPAAVVYTTLIPDSLEKGFANMFANLDEISNVANDLLQGKFAQAANDGARFVINTTFGIGGLFDVADPMGLPRSEGEDFAQTLAAWGVPSGPFLMLPLIGPSTLRDAPSKFVDSLTNPVSELSEVSDRNSLRALSLLSTRAELLDYDDVVSGDKYIFIRDIYLQRREYLENDGVVEDNFGDLDDY